MDELTAGLGQLSTNAREWKPGTAYSSQPEQAPQASSFDVAGAAEFVPGVRMTTAGGGAGAGGAIREFVPGVGMTGGGEDPTGGAVASSSGAVGGWEGPAAPGTTTAAAPPVPATPLSSHRTLHSLGLPEDLWSHYRALSAESAAEMSPDDPRHKAVPPSYTNAYPLDADDAAGNMGGRKRSSFGYPTSVFRVTSRDDGRLYCLRRLDSVRCVSHKIAGSVRDVWANATDPSTGSTRLVDHPNLVRLYRAFVSQRAVFFVHRYQPGARTMRERYMDPQHGGGVPLPEGLIWSIVTQLVSAIKAVHGANLAVRTLQLNHVLCTTEAGVGTVGTGAGAGRVRVRVNCIGVPDALEFEARKPLDDLRREDMNSFGRIILSLATGQEMGEADLSDDHMARCDSYLARNYSPSLRSLAMALLSNRPPTIFDVAGTVAQHAFDELDAAQTAVDRVDEALSAEYESGRALRLLLKLGFVNERPEFGVDGRWSETGDCYVLKLFRDYVFHQADGSGRPVMDLGHVVTVLNKLDAADEEKIVLASRDGKNILVVSFADVARCLEGAYGELCEGSVPPAIDGPGQMGGY